MLCHCPRGPVNCHTILFGTRGYLNCWRALSNTTAGWFQATSLAGHPCARVLCLPLICAAWTACPLPHLAQPCPSPGRSIALHPFTLLEVSSCLSLLLPRYIFKSLTAPSCQIYCSHFNAASLHALHHRLRAWLGWMTRRTCVCMQPMGRGLRFAPLSSWILQGRQEMRRS